MNDLVLEDEKVSRRHAMVHAQGDGEYWLVDLGSANGTYLNARRVTQPCRVNDGDRIAIAGHSFLFRHTGPRPAPLAERPTETFHEVRSEQCWLLVADLENSTHFIQRLSANDVPRITGRWLAGCKQVIDENKGTINKFLGDGFFAYWADNEGIPIGVARAIKSLREVQLQDGPRFRFVLHYGAVSMGGAATLGEESLMGAEVNFVFRMEKLAGMLGMPCLISEAANAAFDSILPTSEQGQHPVPGFVGDYRFFTA
jgi:adenylate cyclase